MASYRVKYYDWRQQTHVEREVSVDSDELAHDCGHMLGGKDGYTIRKKIRAPETAAGSYWRVI